MLANRIISSAAPGYFEDTFDVDSTGSYTQSADANATWAVSGGELVATGGTHALFIRNATSYSDVAIEADVNWAYDGGLILRFIDNDNYYILVLNDDSGGAPTLNIRIYKRVSGTFTALDSGTNITWPRGTSILARFEASGSTLKSYINGSLIATVTDSSIAGHGGVGVRNNASGQQSKYQAFRWGL